jgi:3-isopropylmalate dehydrogenase
VKAEYPSVAVDYQHVDAACIYSSKTRSATALIVTDNLFGDILSDLAGTVTGGIGYAASGKLNPTRSGPLRSNPSTERLTTSPDRARPILWPVCPLRL